MAAPGERFRMMTGALTRRTTGRTVDERAYVVTCRNSRSTSALRNACPAATAFSGLSIRPRFTSTPPRRPRRPRDLPGLIDQPLLKPFELAPEGVRPEAKKPMRRLQLPS